jgi:transposase
MVAFAPAHHWVRKLEALGRDVRLMPASYVKASVKRGKNDAAHAAAICEAVTRPSMRFVPIKSVEQQAVLMLHRARDLPFEEWVSVLGPAQTDGSARPSCVSTTKSHA